MSYVKNENKSVNESKTTSGSSLELQNWKDYYQIIRERLFLGIGAALLVGGVVGYMLLQQPPVYSSTASLMLGQQGSRVIDIQEVVETGLDDHRQMWRVSLQNHINKLTSRSFRGYVIDSLTDEEQDKIMAAYINDDVPPSLSRLVGSVDVEALPESFILEIRARHRDPDAAALIANSYVSRYVDFNLERRQAGNAGAMRFLRERERELSEELEDAEAELQEYRTRHTLVSVDENQSLVAQKLAAITGNLTEARLYRLKLESELRQVEDFKRDGRNLLEISSLSGVGSTSEVVGELDSLRNEREIMSDQYGNRHPRMIANQRGIDAAETLIQENLELAISNLRNQLSQAREHEKDLLVELREAEEESLALDRVKVRYAALERTVATKRNTHSQVVRRLHETSITSQMENSTIRIFEQASPPNTPIEPNLTRIAMLVVFLGGFFLLGTPIGLAALENNKLKHAREVESFLDQKLLGELTFIGKMKKSARPHVVAEESDDRAGEVFRSLYSQIQLTTKATFPKSILVTSTIPGEGKSLVVNNLSSCFAAHGKRTLLIDFDLRNSSLHRFYGRLNKVGILSWLEKEEEPNEENIIDELGIGEVAPNLFLLSSGGQTKKATEMIGMAGVEAMLAILKRRFDVLLIDTPPLGVFADVLPLAQLADESIYVVHFGKVDRNQVRDSIHLLRETKTDLLGVVMNGMPQGARHSHYYANYGLTNSQYARYYVNRR